MLIWTLSNFVFLIIMVMAHENFTVNMSTRNGNKIKARISMSIFMITLSMK